MAELDENQRKGKGGKSKEDELQGTLIFEKLKEKLLNTSLIEKLKSEGYFK